MESSGSPGKPDDPSPKWSDLLGTVIALLTLTIPMLVISYYSYRPTTPNLSPEVSVRLLE